MLHYQTKEEYKAYPENIKKGCAGLGMPNVAAFVRHCPNLIATHWTETEDKKVRTLQLAEKMLQKEPLDLKIVEIGGNSSYANWYKVLYAGEIFSFGLNTRIDHDYLNSFSWA